MDSFKIIFVKDTFKRDNRLSERHFLTKFRKDDFDKYKNFGQKVSFFTKTIFEQVHISNKHHKSQV
jgi:hypothetical protein